MDVTNITKERFLEAKKSVLKKYPEAKTLMDNRGKYFVANKGYDVTNIQLNNTVNHYDFGPTFGGSESSMDDFMNTLDRVCNIPHSKTVKEAWMKAEATIKAHHIVERNSDKFNDEKVIDKMIKFE